MNVYFEQGGFMNNREIAENLKELSKLYADSAWNYERALNSIQDEDLRLELTEMHAEHIEQFDNFNTYIKQLGERPIKYQSTGEMSAEIVAIKEGMSDEEIINTLRKNEQVINSRLQSIVDEVQIPEIAHDLEEDIDVESGYIETLKDFMD
jgi:hypothetical protein